MREIVLDTETTGLDPKSGDRIVEIGCVELTNRMATGETFQCYINPERDMPAEAEAVHGLSEKFLSGHPVFGEIADSFLEFIGGSPLVIHNAAFDLGFLNAELERAGRAKLGNEHAVDTVAMARRKFPGAQASLDALCRRFQIDNSDRGTHGALKDARLLADVYLELTGGRQPGLELARAENKPGAETRRLEVRPPRAHAPSAEEEAAHAGFLDKLENPVWRAG